MWSLRSFLCLPMGVSCIYALMFTSLRKKAEEIQGKYTCFNAILSEHPTLAFSHRGHVLIRQNLQEQAQDSLDIMLLWLFFIVLMYMTLKLAGESGEMYMFHTLALLKMDLVKFVSRVQNLKLTTSISGNLNPLNVEVPADV
ncbi:hypothetical protein FD754_024877 [Muntiacus muntjak]|uniref:Uncharacterized protein n=1 Tax=Muntiacus muntjak TaxID=9888 RepID=A0A5N3UMZ8_MUNMU|nr:hypothetical protein FD754_024877 [Muntiacus muntjak]